MYSILYTCTCYPHKNFVRLKTLNVGLAGICDRLNEYSSSDVTGEMTGHEMSDESESHASSDEMELGLSLFQYSLHHQLECDLFAAYI